MTSHVRFLLSASLVSVALMGFGCAQVPSLSKVTFPVPSGPKSAVFSGLSPKAAAKKIMFVGGSVIVMQQGFGGIGGKLAQRIGFGGHEGTREIVVTSFAPGNRADIAWKLKTRVQTDPKDVKDTGIRETVGSILGGKLLSAHKLYPPGYWVEGEKDAFDTSIIWLSQDVFDDLSKNHVSTLDLGITDRVIAGQLSALQDVQSAIAKLRGEADAVGKRKDVFLIESDPEPSTRKLKINGAEVEVQVLKARSWFGEIVALDHRENPLVLKVTLNPLALAAADAMIGSGFLKNALGYEITELRDILE